MLIVLNLSNNINNPQQVVFCGQNCVHAYAEPIYKIWYFNLAKF